MNARHRMIPILMVVFMALLPGMAPAEPSWYKGAMHCHSNAWEGDSSPEEMVKWYRDHGYHFLVLTDHDRFTDVTQRKLNSSKDFLVIAGEEVGTMAEKKVIHMNAVNINRHVKPVKAKTVEEVLVKTVKAIRDAGGIPLLNHPSYKNHILPVEIAVIEGFFLIEIYNAMSSTGLENRIRWDMLLQMGKRVYGVASDDAHYHKKKKKDGWGNPGRAWVMVRAPELTTDALMRSLREGDFYCTTGVVLSELSARAEEYRIEITPEKDTEYTVTFCGAARRVLQKTKGAKASYHYRDDDIYVRAEVESSQGKMAFTQPVFLRKPPWNKP
ncbi:MAG: CehA/McbA family metallohydrolase [Candidatus Eremiobacteraeota bacterium]|nr:CehA/McbA family metallohydrolase [Candidatus Eremiobacteraeota bacterium]